MLTSAKFQTLCVTERHEALNALTRDQLIEFTEGFTPSAGLPVGAESCWRTLALRLAIELRYCDCCVPNNPCADPNNPACECVHCESVEGKTINGHVLHTKDDCQEFHGYDMFCPVCAGGLAICKWCGAAEHELDFPCVCQAVDPTTACLEAMSAADVASGLFCRQCRKQTWATKDGYCPDCMPPAVKAAFDKAMSADEVAMIEAAGDCSL